MSAVAGFMSGVASGIKDRQRRDERKADREAIEQAAAAKRQDDWWGSSEGHYAVPNGSGGLMPDGPPRPRAGGRGLSRPASGGGRRLTRAPSGSGAPLAVKDPVNDELPIEARAFLNGVSGGESAGAYNVRYTPDGPATFDPANGHPRIFEDGPHGKSSAAGRYQFTATTWDEYGGDDFSARAQDAAAWKLGQDRYRAQTGRDLLGDLRSSGMTAEMQAALAPTWAAFGVEKNRGRWSQLYSDSLARYRGSQPASQPARQPAGRSLSAAKPKARKTWAWTDDVMSGLELKGAT